MTILGLVSREHGWMDRYSYEITVEFLLAPYGKHNWPCQSEFDIPVLLLKEGNCLLRFNFVNYFVVLCIVV